MRTTERRGTTARRRELGSELRQARERVLLSVAEAAEMLGWSTTKISRAELGDRGITEVDTARYLAICRMPLPEVRRVLDLARETDDGYRLRPHGQRLPDELRSLVFHETTASAMSCFELSRVPGLLQTRDYAHEIVRHSVAVPDDGIGVRVEARMDRQRLLRQRRPPRCVFFVHEQALRLVVGGNRVMHEQLLFLTLAANWADCVVRVVPCAAGPHPGLNGPFVLMDYRQHPSMVYIENETASVFLEQEADLDVYRGVVRGLAAIALDEEQSRTWLAERASEYERAEDGPDECRAGS